MCISDNLILNGFFLTNSFFITVVFVDHEFSYNSLYLLKHSVGI